MNTIFFNLTNQSNSRVYIKQYFRMLSAVYILIKSLLGTFPSIRAKFTYVKNLLF